MKFGVFDHVDASGEALGQHLATRLDLAEVYDQCGLYGYHVAEHHGTPLGHAPSPSVLLSAVSQRTTNLRIGPLVYLLPLYHPLRLIEAICMLDQLSDGRFMLGVGKGVSPFELGFYGADPETAQAHYQETLDCILEGLTSDTLTFNGQYSQFDNVPMTLRPVQQPHPPLWYGAINPESAVWTATNAVNIVTIALSEGGRALTDRYRAEWEKLGRDPAELPLMGISRHVVVADTEGEAKRIAARAYALWRANFVKLWHEAGVDVPFISALYPETWDALEAIGNGFAGTAEQVADYVHAESEAAGVNYFVSWFAFGDLTFEQAARSARLFSRKVIPAFEPNAI